ncbi:hypothetical protein GGI55_001784 [Rhizobium leguminosarum]|uniref:winged helix domain-containing protein n=1 Tax=Rhizobium TaxID=379 RepID=UPI001829C883|nr:MULTISPECIES: hypothetical protein [Rhizobium]MBB4297257.1 hypothetical protein [Rhizobium leguminosarum]MBB4415317.1 hypothetical protein [Rhizobium leguminosarum]MBB4431716.1 hypothetical protein [Rhizobium esperanzae]MBB4539668.1 hypothetical protein [Rhizobium leguminosarum]MBB5651939.1 hypothetical protein [Rhizobium leguminosarum]
MTTSATKQQGPKFGDPTPAASVKKSQNDFLSSPTERPQMTEKPRARTLMRVQIMDKGSPVSAPITVVGRDAWALQTLLDAGTRGFSSIERPAPRTSHYIFKLRRFGFAIETITEVHGGAYRGHHARYVLHSDVRVLEGKAA